MPFNRTVLYEGKSPYGSYKVVDTLYNGRRARVLYGSDRSPQSGVALDDEPELLFDYNQRFLELIMSTRPKRVLIIGGGAFMLPIAAHQRFPSMHIDVVEIDALLVKLAHDFFDLPKSKKLNVHVADGAQFVKQAKKRYDMIIIDAFSGFSIPPHLLEKDILLEYQRLLSRGGSIALNFISAYKKERQSLAHELVAVFKEVFPSVALYQADTHYYKGEEQNMLLVAANEPAHFDYLHSDAVDLLPPPRAV